MKQTALEVPTRYHLKLDEVLSARGMHFADLVAGAGLHMQALTDANATISFAQVEKLVTSIQAAATRTDIAFELGKLLTVSSHSYVGFGMLNCVNLDAALRFEAKYFRLVFPAFNMRYQAGRDFAEIQFTPVISMSHACLAFHLETIALATIRKLSDLTESRLPPCQLDFSIPAPPHAARYRELPRVDARFNTVTSPALHIRLDNAPSNYKLAFADSCARRIAEQRCRSMVHYVTTKRHFADWVEMRLREVGEALPTLEELAGLLNISKRTLNRYLQRDGTSFREIAGRVQHELACQRLAVRGATVSSVAYSLGFSDAANFARAFRAKAGCSPSDYIQHASGRPDRQEQFEPG